VNRKPIRRTQAERRENTQRRVVDAAVEVLRRDGYAGFRVTAVARAAKVSRGAQTHHFPTKESLVLAAIEQVFRQAKERSLERVRALSPDDDVVAALLADCEEFFLGPYFPIALDMLNLGDRGPRLRKMIQAMSRGERLPVEQAWSAALEARGLGRQQAEDILWLSYSVVRGLAVRRLMQEDSVRTRRAIDLWHDIARRLIGSLPRARAA